jgi:hypothetical protein
LKRLSLLKNSVIYFLKYFLARIIQLFCACGIVNSAPFARASYSLNNLAANRILATDDYFLPLAIAVTNCYRYLHLGKAFSY